MIGLYVMISIPFLYGCSGFKEGPVYYLVFVTQSKALLSFGLNIFFCQYLLSGLFCE